MSNFIDSVNPQPHPGFGGLIGADGALPDGRAQALTDRLAEGAHHTIDRIAESAGPQVDRLEQAASDAGVEVMAQARHWREMGADWTESVRGSVRRNPLMAVAAALAAGMLVGRIRR